jgi:signal transduction histidine kinase
MVVGGQLIGVLDVQSNEVNRFTQADVRIQSTLADQIAVAIQNAYSFQATQAALAQTQQYTLALTHLNEMSQTLSSAADDQAIFDVAAAKVPDILPVDRASIALLQGDHFEVLALQGDAGAIRVGANLPFDGTLLGLTVRDNRIVNTPDTHAVEYLDAKALAQQGLGSLMSAPIIVGGHPIGTLNVGRSIPDGFGANEENLIRQVVLLLGATLQNRRFFTQIEKRAAELQAVAQVSAATTSILDVDELLQAVADLTKASFKLYHTHIYLLDEAGDTLALAAGADEVGRLMKAQGRTIRLDAPTSIVARAARGRQGVISNDVFADPNFLPHPLLPETQAELATPMVLGDKLIGVLDVQANEVNAFTEEDMRIQSTLADQIAVAVENARAFKIQQETAERLREVDRLKSQFLANMSHELRTPLNSIIGYAEVLLDGIDGDLTEEANEDVQAIYSGGRHLLGIINDILDLAKIEAGQMFMDRREADVVKVAEEVLHSLEVLVKDKDLEFILEPEADLPPVYADPLRLRQIILNLVNNALKFTERGGITVRLGRYNDQQVFVSVKDSGMGMNPEDIQVIFERFRQVDGSATRRAGGTGLGLAITRHLIHMHEGEIYVESEKGAGSTFWFTLPIYEAEKV